MCKKACEMTEEDCQELEEARAWHLKEKEDLKFQLKYYKDLVDDLLEKNHILRKNVRKHEAFINDIKEKAVSEYLKKKDDEEKAMKDKYHDIPPAMVALDASGIVPPPQPFYKG